jgi:hypothetical protein
MVTRTVAGRRQAHAQISTLRHLDARVAPFTPLDASTDAPT